MEREAQRAWEELGEAKPQSEYIVWKKKSIFNRRELERKKRMLSKEDRPNT